MNIETTQIGAMSRGSAKGAIPGVLLGSIEDDQVQIEASHGDGFLAGG